MKVCVIQPYYSFSYNDLDRCFNEMTALIDRCDDSMDLIVLPEYCDIPAATENGIRFRESIEKYNRIVYEKVKATAVRCHAIVFANFGYKSETGWRNTTYAFDRNGNEVGRYFKAHPAPSEVKTVAEGGNEMDVSYSYEYAKPYTVELEGIRFGFMTCYDFYMYEEYPALARQDVDIIIGCSHQRTDTHNALDIIGRFLSYHTNAYLVRSSVSLGEDSPLCGCSMIVNPKGEMLVNMESRIGLGVAEIDPHDKYYKPAGFRGREKSHYEYIDEGRRPWLYRPSGSMMINSEALLPYPRICAHRGFSTVAPENSLPAFGAAVALGADEIEFDLWATKDRQLVSIHDYTLERVSNGKGNIWDYTYDELARLDFGSIVDEHFAGLRIVRFEDILKKFACTTIMNIHVKIWDFEKEDPMFGEIASLIRQYDCQKHVYMMSTSDRCLRAFHEIAPEINRCVGWDGSKEDFLSMPRRAEALGCNKIQLFKPYFDRSTVDYAKAHGILTNVFFADDPEEACRYIDMGIDTVLTNDYYRVASAVKEHLKNKKS